MMHYATKKILNLITYHANAIKDVTLLLFIIYTEKNRKLMKHKVEINFESKL